MSLQGGDLAHGAESGVLQRASAPLSWRPAPRRPACSAACTVAATPPARFQESTPLSDGVVQMLCVACARAAVSSGRFHHWHNQMCDGRGTWKLLPLLLHACSFT